jgi:hypothetical protein
VIDAVIDRLCAWRDERRRKRWQREHEEAEAKAASGTLTDAELIYAAHARCPCGAGLAYPKGIGPMGFWDCSDILTGRAALKGEPGSVKHEARLPFIFYEIKSEQQPSADGATTRPR